MSIILTELFNMLNCLFIFQSSRETIGRLSDFAEIADLETKHQIAQLHKKLQKERDHAKYLEMKHKTYKVSRILFTDTAISVGVGKTNNYFPLCLLRIHLN